MFRSRNVVVLVLAGLMLALSFGSGAMAARLITGKQIKDGTVTTADIKNKSLKTKDFSAKTRAQLTGPKGDPGDTGLQGIQGLPGDPGLPGVDGVDGVDGVSGFEVVTASQSVLSLASNSVQASCSNGKVALAAAGGFASPLATLFSQVTRVDDDTFSVAGLNNSLASELLSLSVTCVSLAP